MHQAIEHPVLSLPKEPALSRAKGTFARTYPHRTTGHVRRAPSSPLETGCGSSYAWQTRCKEPSLG
jgi:hypothetical protein